MPQSFFRNINMTSGTKAVQYLKDFLFVAIAAVMLVLAFPGFNLGFVAWFALVPLLWVIVRRRPLWGFLFSFFFGLIFYSSHFFWMFELARYTALHHLLLGVYLSLLTGAFGLFVCWITGRCGPAAGLSAAPFIWVCIESLRSNLSFLSLPWALLGHSQYQYPLLIQMASLSGVFGIGFLIVLVNSALTILVWSLLNRSILTIPASTQPLLSSGAKALIGAAAVCFAVNVLYGYTLTAKAIPGAKYRISLVQANIEQSKKWDKQYAKFILDTYAEMTRIASGYKPDLIVWPETATPGAINLDRTIAERIGQIAREASAPLLLGSTQQGKFELNKSKTLKHQNTAFLLPAANRSVRPQRYHKIRLLPFGEYLPFKDTIPWASIGVPKISGYQPGSEYMVLELPDFKFAATICWENLFPDLVRQFVK
jgi:apolipoprotein N-acyltransferase